MELFRALAQVATGTGPLLRARPRTRFEATDQTGRIDVVEPEIEAGPLLRSAPPPSPSAAPRPATTEPAPSAADAPVGPRTHPPAIDQPAPAPLVPRPERIPPADLGPRSRPSAPEQATPATSVPGPITPVAPDASLVPPTSSPAAPEVGWMVRERETRHVIERLRVEDRAPEPAAVGPAPRRDPIGRGEAEPPARDDRDAGGRPPPAPLPTAAPPAPRRPVYRPPPPPARRTPAPSFAPSRRAPADSEQPDPASPSEPAVVVHIGRLEVRTVVPAKPAPAPAPLHFAGPDLGDFLGATP
jgi:hypothetical protein